MFRQQIGRIDDEHSAAVHTEAVGFRRVDVQFGVKVVVGNEFFNSSGSLRLSSRLRQGYQMR